MNSYIDINMKVKFPNSTIELTQSQKNRFGLFNGFNEIELFKYENEFKSLLNNEIKIDYNNIDQVEEHFKLLSYFGDKEINKFYEEIYAIESKSFKKEVENFIEDILIACGTWRKALEPLCMDDILWNSYTSLESIISYVENKQPSNNYWWYISANPYIDEKFVETYKDKIKWKPLSRFGKNRKVLANYLENSYDLDNKSIKSICKNLYVSDSFVQRYVSILDWDDIFLYSRSTIFLEENINKLNWMLVSHYSKFEFIQNHTDKIDWSHIGYNPYIPEDFFEENIDQLNWDNISQNHGLSEAFFRKYIDKINWNEMSGNKNIPNSFLIEFIDKLDFERLSYNRSTTEEFWKNHIDKINWKLLCKNPNISPQFFMDNYSNINLGTIFENSFSYYVNRRVKSIKKYSFDILWQKIDNDIGFYKTVHC